MCWMYCFHTTSIFKSSKVSPFPTISIHRSRKESRQERNWNRVSASSDFPLRNLVRNPLATDWSASARLTSGGRSPVPPWPVVGSRLQEPYSWAVPTNCPVSFLPILELSLSFKAKDIAVQLVREFCVGQNPWIFGSIASECSATSVASFSLQKVFVIR